MAIHASIWSVTMDLLTYYLLLTIVSNIKLLKIIIFDIPGNHEKARTFPEIIIKPESLLMLSWVIEREQWPSIS